MRRRDFISFLGSAAIAWPLGAHAQQVERMRRIGFLHGLVENDPEAQARIKAFRHGLEALGWSEGRNIQVDYRFARGDAALARTSAEELVSLAPDLLVGLSTPVTAALKQATRTIPIIFAVVTDPVGQGFIASLARPGGNVTGFTFIDYAMVGKWLEILKEIAPNVKRAAVLFNPETSPYYPGFLRELGSVPATLAVELTAAPVRDESEIEEAVTTLARAPGGGLIAASDPFITARRALIITLAQRHRLPAVYYFRQFPAEGGLMSYGPEPNDIARRAASYVDRILRGAKPADLPVQGPTKFELVINLRTAKALGIDVPPTLLARAEEVIE
jgi:putative ABC transport system substrate-binding protein